MRRAIRKLIIVQIFKATIDKAFGYPFLRREFRRRVGYDLCLDDPKTMNEKIQWRKINDRNPLLATISDKLDVQNYIRTKLSEDELNNLFVPCLQVATHTNQIKLENLPTTFVMKPTHGSGWVHVQSSSNTLTETELRELARTWLRTRYGIGSHQWGYTQLKPRIMFEELINGQRLGPVDEIKLHVFDGRIQHIFYVTHVDGRPKWLFFDRAWTALNQIDGVTPIPRPANYERIVHIAEKVAEDFDYIRVDFMVGETGCFLNELTAYNASGFDADPEGGEFIFDEVDGIGTYWTLPKP